MAPGGALEMIWHFAGYWHIAQEYAAARLKYDEAFYKAQNIEYRVEAADAVGPFADIPDMTGQAVRANLSSSSTGSGIDIAILKAHSHGFPRIEGHAPMSGRHGDLMLDEGDQFHGPATGGGSLHIRYMHVHVAHRPVEHGAPDRGGHGGHREPSYSLSYDEPPSGVVGKLTQVNAMSDHDRVSDGGTGYDALQAIDADATVSRLVDMGTELIPQAAIPLGWLGDASVDDVLAHDRSLAEGSASPGEVAPGRYVNGELQQADAPSSEPPDHVVPALPERSEPDTEPGHVAETGANKAGNAALILDFNEAPANLLVRGDYFSTNAILQANILQNQDHVLDAGSQPPILEGGSNTTDNTAVFKVTTLLEGTGSQAYKGNLTVNVDYVTGDLFDIKALTQRSVLQDGDVSVQTTTEAYSEVRTGGNEQYNVTKFLDWGKGYDIIVVLGDYHSANIISQLNVVLDNDVVGLGSAEGEGGAPQAFLGQNALRNEATIQTIGSASFGTWTDELQKLIEGLASRDDVDRGAWSGFKGAASGTLDVLFVTGDYYDLNIINQVNLISDSDVAVQWRDEGSSLQWSSTGGNAASNSAVIVDASALSSHVIGGGTYEDSILLQANLVSDGTQAVQADPTALVTELVAFIDHAQGETVDANAWTKDVFVSHHDTFGHVLT